MYIKTHGPALGSRVASAVVGLLIAAAGGDAAEPPKSGAVKSNKPVEQQSTFPTWKDVETAAVSHFKSLPNYQAGDIVSHGQVKPLLDQLAKAGWKVSDRDALLAQISADNDLIVAQLRSKSGVKFMRKLGGSAEQYDRLRRLAETKGGDRTVSDIMKLPNGNDVLAALVESKAGKDIARQLSKGPRTRDFNKPTGYLYTQEQVMARLAESYRRDSGK